MNNVPFLGQNSFESVGVGLLKDSSLMGFFPFPAPPTPGFHIKHDFDSGTTILRII
jgi:hypothetical protein